MHNKRLLERVDALILVNTRGPSYGSILELGYAHNYLGIPCFGLVLPEYLNHPYLKTYTITLADDVESIIKSIKRYFNI